MNMEEIMNAQFRDSKTFNKLLQKKTFSSDRRTHSW
jgi:hypothetical protein